ncbi:MAG: Co2+/Mg2+ efflux protein ApaG [Hyphomicrobiaceae bacterium]
MYEATTRNIRVSVTPQYLESESRPERNNYFWAYTIVIENEGHETVQLRSRYWHITDANGKVSEVRGAGVVGEQPTIEPGGSYSYTSGCPLDAPSGIMVGQYQMLSDSGETFDIDIPAFSLDSPEGLGSIN